MVAINTPDRASISRSIFFKAADQHRPSARPVIEHEQLPWNAPYGIAPILRIVANVFARKAGRVILFELCMQSIFLVSDDRKRNLVNIPKGKSPALPFSFPMACLLTVFMTAAAGCASAPLYRTHPEWPQRKSTIKTVGLLPPMISMYEEQYRFGMHKVVPHDDWSREATDAVQKVLIDEMAALGLPAKVVDEEDRDLDDMLDLYSAVDMSINRHAWEDHGSFYGEVGVVHSPPQAYDNLKEIEPFPGKARSFDYSLGPVREALERHQVDAVWIVTGFNLLPTTGAEVGDEAAYFFAFVGALAGANTNPSVLKKFELRAALVDKNGEIVFYAILDKWNVPTEEGVKEDARNPRFARRYIRALLAEYRKAVAK